MPKEPFDRSRYQKPDYSNLDNFSLKTFVRTSRIREEDHALLKRNKQYIEENVCHIYHEEFDDDRIETHLLREDPDMIEIDVRPTGCESTFFTLERKQAKLFIEALQLHIKEIEEKWLDIHDRDSEHRLDQWEEDYNKEQG